MWTIPTAVSVLDHGDFDLDEYRPALKTRGFIFITEINGHYFSQYPFGSAIVAAPIVAVLRPVARAISPALHASLEASIQARQGCPPVAAEPVISLHAWTELIAASIIVSATMIVLFFIAREYLSLPHAALFALIFALGTSAWSTASRSLWQHGPSMFLLSLALLAQIRGWSAWFAGFLLAFAYVVRPTNAVPLAFGGLWLVLSQPRRVPAYLVGALAVLVPLFAMNFRAYGAWLSPYYQPGFFHGNPFFWEAMAGNLISPARGLLVYSPVFIFSALGVFLKLRTRTFKSLDAFVVGCIVCHLVVISLINRNWWGGYSYGPRFLSDMLPYFMYLLIPAFLWMRSHRTALTLTAAVTFATTAGVSVAMHAEGVFDTAPGTWNRVPNDIDTNPVRLWDWRHPPFLARWRPQPLAAIDVAAVACERPPEAPQGFRLVANDQSTLVASWRPAAGPVAVYVVESGSGPGMANFPAREASPSPDPSVTVYRVPPGTYFARVRAKNACGVSPPSNEIEVVVH